MRYEPPAGGCSPRRSPGHEQDFIDCVKTRKDPIMPIEAGHAASTLCILGNLSYVLRRKLGWDWKRERFVGDNEANRLLARPSRAPWRI